MKDYWKIADKRFKSRLLHCFGSVNDEIDLKTAVNFIKRSETEFLTVYTQGKLNLMGNKDELNMGYSGLRYKDIKKHIDVSKYTVLVNTNHALSVDEAVSRAEIGSKLLKTKWIKLEVLNKKLTRPINKKVIKAAKILLKKGFIVMPLITADLKDAVRLVKMKCSAIRVLLSDIGSEKGLVNKKLFKKICLKIKIPVIAEGGIGAPEDAYNAMAVGASAVLVNRSLFCYKDPLFFIDVLKQSIKSGRLTYICNQQRHDIKVDNNKT